MWLGEKGRDKFYEYIQKPEDYIFVTDDLNAKVGSERIGKTVVITDKGEINQKNQN